MDDDKFNMSMRKFLKQVGVTSQQKIEDAVRASGKTSGKVKVTARTLRIDVDNQGSDGTDFHVPLDLAWTEAGERMSRRVMLDPGRNRVTIDCGSKPARVEIVRLERVLGRHDVSVD